MRRIIYQSSALPDFNRGDLFRLVYHARIANEQKGLSGFLIFCDQRFLQLLEGETWKLVATFGKIRTDLRHTNIGLLDERSVDGRLFGGWRMRCFADQPGPEALDVISREASRELPKVVEHAVRSFLGCDATQVARPLRIVPV